MDDLKRKIQEVLSGPQLAVLATIKDSAPWCRYVFMIADNDMNIRCATKLDARKVSQIKTNKEVHVTCGVTSLSDQQPYLQIQANASVSTDQNDKDAFWNPGLEEIFESKDDPSFAVINITPYRIEYCAPGKPEPEVLDLV